MTKRDVNLNEKFIRCDANFQHSFVPLRKFRMITNAFERRQKNKVAIAKILQCDVKTFASNSQEQNIILKRRTQKD